MCLSTTFKSNCNPRFKGRDKANSLVYLLKQKAVIKLLVSLSGLLNRGACTFTINCIILCSMNFVCLLAAVYKRVRQAHLRCFLLSPKHKVFLCYFWINAHPFKVLLSNICLPKPTNCVQVHPHTFSDGWRRCIHMYLFFLMIMKSFWVQIPPTNPYNCWIKRTGYFLS